jgi:hypothetical protein
VSLACHMSLLFAIVSDSICIFQPGLHRLMISGSVVVKHTIFPEWHHDWMTPWVHYIVSAWSFDTASSITKLTCLPPSMQPMQLDFSDLYNIMVFFVGSPDGRQAGRDDLAQQIAEQGKKFAEEHWRWENMQVSVQHKGGT